MNAFNRAFLSLLTLGWCAGLVGIGVLLWDQSRVIDLDRSTIHFLFDLDVANQAEQILGTIILGLLALPALIVLGLELMPSRRGTEEHSRTKQLEARVESLQRQVEEERNLKNAPLGDRPRQPATNRRWRFLPGHRG